MDRARESSSASALESPAPTQIKRNTACVRCRDAKVRCNASLDPKRPCLRCEKADLICVIDKNHKRSSRKSKLEELAAEVRNIKQAVDPRATAVTTAPTAAPTAAPATAPPPPPPPLSDTPRTDRRLLTGSVIPGPTSVVPVPITIPGVASILAPLRPGDAQGRVAPPATYTSPPQQSRQAAEPRALGSRVLSGEDIDHYFDRYFEHFHPFLPVVRVRDPNACYKAAPILFWAIITTACRRYARDDTVFQFLIETLPQEVWAAVAQPPLQLPIINALLILVAWPLSSIRFMKDPSHLLVGIALHSCLFSGFRAGKGRMPEFANVNYGLETTDEEAAYTWAACNILSQRVSTYMGCASTAMLSGKTIDSMLDGTIPCGVPRGFVLDLETARFSNRVNKTMSAYLEQAQGVPQHVVSQMEEELTQIQALFAPGNSDLDNFTLLLALLDLQSFYLMPAPGTSEALVKRNVLRCYQTAARAATSALGLQRDAALLSHAPHVVFRALVGALCVLMCVHTSPLSDDFDHGAADALANDTLMAIRACSVQDEDLAMRVSNMAEACWSIRHHIPREERWVFGPSRASHRLGASIVFDCLPRWKAHIDRFRSSTAANPQTQVADSSGAVDHGQAGPEADMPPVDQYLQIDWDTLMDDVDWTFNTNYPAVP